MEMKIEMSFLRIKGKKLRGWLSDFKEKMAQKSLKTKMMNKLKCQFKISETCFCLFWIQKKLRKKTC